MNVIRPGYNEYNHERNLRGFKITMEQIMDFLNYKENPNLTDTLGTTLLHFAIADNCDNLEIVTKLIKAGADVNARNNWEQTPLHIAVLCHNWSVIDTLISCNADINGKELNGNTALHFAVDLFWSKRKHDQPETRSHIVKKLLHYGADPNIPNACGETALMLAVKYDYMSIVEDLLAFGANVHARNQYSKTCLHMISLCLQPDIHILKELVRNGACVNCVDHAGRTPLDVFLDNNKLGYGWRLAESLIKVTILIYWKYEIVFQTSQSRGKTRRLEEFIDRCYKEISRMKSYVYSDESTLCHFAINGNKAAKMEKSQESIFDEVLDTLVKDDFSIYHDIIELHFDKTSLKKKLFKMNIYTRNDTGKVRLHPFAIDDIASYLSEKDLLNLIIAYSKP